MGDYGPLFLAPAEGLGCASGYYIWIINEKIPGKSIDIWLIYGFVKIWP